jgi:hypothetical protein
MERGEAMHFKPKGVLGIAVPVLLGGALAAGALALPAHAQSYSDTALSASDLTVTTFSGTLTAQSGSGVIDLAGSGVTWSPHGTWPTGVSLSTTTNGEATISCSGCTPAASQELVADATDSAGSADALEIDAAIATASSIEVVTDTTPVQVHVSGLTVTNTAGTVTFSGATSSKSGNTITIAEQNLPTGLTSGNPLTYSGGTAAPNTYGGIGVTATDSDGAVQAGAFTLTVSATTVSGSGTTGDEVNKFGYGFDSYRQHDYAGAIVVGWTATSSDPATQFLMNNGSHSGYYQFEYAPNGSGSGLCMSDPGGGWGSDPLRDGLILANCNSGPFQQFFPESDGTLVNLATGLIIDPAGKGGQLRGGSSAVAWGGSSYTWESGE